MSATNLSIVACIHRRPGSATPSCGGRGATLLVEQLQQLLRESRLEVPLRYVECLGECARGPNLRIAPGGPFFHGVTAADLPAVIDALQRMLQGADGGQVKG